ncbi:MAG: sugar phosphate isomerase/epimerase [Acidobacteriota bacterium]|nr:sugar phosphate isomerase/epimerase [Acidobacteriota bacterium]
MTRREAWLATAGVLASTTAKAAPALPLLCLFSKALRKVGYTELGEIVKQLGFDGVDLAVRPDGHVEPRLSNVDLVRAFESIAGAGLECPMITTALTSPLEPTALAVIAISGRTQIPLFRVGDWRAAYSPSYLRDIRGLVSVGSRYNIAMALHNYTGENAGETDWNVAETLAGLDPKWAGAYFDPIHHGEQWETALRPLLPRLRAVALKDFKIARGDAIPCPLGEGSMDFRKLFTVLAQAGYRGPLSLRVEYAPEDELGAIGKDCQFARKQLEAAYVRIGSGSGAGSGSGMG